MWTVTMLVLAGAAGLASAHGTGAMLPMEAFPSLADDNAPQQLWINYGDEPTEMVVRYATGNAPDAPLVRWGSAPNSLDKNTTGTTGTYNFGLYTSPHLTFVTLQGLSTATRYYYQCLGANGVWSEVFSFKSHPGVGPEIELVVAVVADLGQTTDSNGTIWHVIASEPDFVIINGDLSYADYDSQRWDSWGVLIQPLSARVPILVTPGNHEVEDVLGAEFVPYKARFRMPNYAQGQNLWWATKVGPLAIYGMNAYSNFSVGSPQYEFITLALQSQHEGETPWGYASWHPPGLCSNTVHQGEGYPIRDTFAASMENNVQVVGCGHVHAYERARNTTGPLFLTIGDGGNREGLYTNWVDPQPSWSLFRDAEYGHGILRYHNSTTATWEWHSLKNPEPVISDSDTIHR